MKLRKRWSSALYVALCALAAGQVMGQETEGAPGDAAPRWREFNSQLELRAGASYSENAARADSGEDSDILALAGIGIDFIRDGSRLDANVSGDLDWVEYLDDTFDGAPRGYFDGNAMFDIIDKSLQWSFRESYGQLISDPLESDTPDNLEDINFFSTGPLASFRFGGANRLSMYATYSRADYGKLDIQNNNQLAGQARDNEQLLGGLQLARNMSEASEIGLNVSANRVEFEESATSSDYDIQSAYLNYALAGFRTSVDASLGYSRVVQDGEDNDGTLIRLGLTRRMSASSNFFLRARQQFSNSGNLFREGLDGANPTSSDPGVSSGDVFEERGLGAGVNFTRTRTRFGVGVDWSEEEHEREAQANREVLAVEAYFVRNLRTTLALNLDARYNSDEYSALNFDDDRLEVGVTLSWQLGRNVGVDFRYDYSQRSASLESSEYDESRYGIRVIYHPFGSRGP